MELHVIGITTFQEYSVLKKKRQAVNFQFSKSSKARFLCVLQPTPTEYIQYSPFLDLKLRVRMRLFQFFSDCELLVRESRQRFLKKAVKFQFLWLEIVNSPEVWCYFYPSFWDFSEKSSLSCRVLKTKKLEKPQKKRRLEVLVNSNDMVYKESSPKKDSAMSVLKT